MNIIFQNFCKLVKRLLFSEFDWKNLVVNDSRSYVAQIFSMIETQV